jgi:hypothetical protein
VVTEKQRKAIADRFSGRACLLDGETAKIEGRLNNFATVARLDNKGSVEFSWNAVERIMTSTMAFRS